MKSSNIYQAVWTDRDFRRYDSDTKMLFLYLLTNANSCGILEFDEDIYNYITRIDFETIEKCLKVIEGKDKIIFDTKTSEIFLLNHFKYNNPANSTRKHQIKFINDYENIKSDTIRYEVKKKASSAVKAVQKAESKSTKKKTIPKPHVDQ